MANSLYLPVRRRGNKVSIAICMRCQEKIYYDDLQRDPNNSEWYCKDCVDLYDPYRLPARRTEDISLQHPRPDVLIEIPGGVPNDVPTIVTNPNTED